MIRLRLAGLSISVTLLALAFFRAGVHSPVVVGIWLWLLLVIHGLASLHRE